MKENTRTEQEGLFAVASCYYSLPPALFLLPSTAVLPHQFPAPTAAKGMAALTAAAPAVASSIRCESLWRVCGEGCVREEHGDVRVKAGGGMWEGVR